MAPLKEVLVATNRAETRVNVALHDVLLLGELPYAHASRLQGAGRDPRAAKGRMAGSHPA